MLEKSEEGVKARESQEFGWEQWTSTPVGAIALSPLKYWSQPGLSKQSQPVFKTVNI